MTRNTNLSPGKPNKHICQICFSPMSNLEGGFICLNPDCTKIDRSKLHFDWSVPASAKPRIVHDRRDNKEYAHMADSKTNTAPVYMGIERDGKVCEARSTKDDTES